MTTTGVATTDKKTYQPGEDISYSFSYCKTKPIVGVVTRALVDGVRMNFASITSDLPLGCHEIWVCNLRIPRNTSAGTYHIEITGEYKINPLRTEVNRLRSNEFEVMGRDPELEYWKSEIIENRNRLDRLGVQ
jgi:hypothetical protein